MTACPKSPSGLHECRRADDVDCRFCGARMTPPVRCPTCGSTFPHDHSRCEAAMTPAELAALLRDPAYHLMRFAQGWLLVADRPTLMGAGGPAPLYLTHAAVAHLPLDGLVVTGHRGFGFNLFSVTAR